MRTRRQRIIGTALFAVVAVVIVVAALLAPPAATDLERPGRSELVVGRAASSSAVRALRRRLAARPADQEAALALARLELSAARRDGDARHLGRAAAAVGDFARAAHPPAPV